MTPAAGEPSEVVEDLTRVIRELEAQIADEEAQIRALEQRQQELAAHSAQWQRKLDERLAALVQVQQEHDARTQFVQQQRLRRRAHEIAWDVADQKRRERAQDEPPEDAAEALRTALGGRSP